MKTKHLMIRSVIALLVLVPFYALLTGSRCTDTCPSSDPCRYDVVKEGGTCPDENPLKPEFAFCDQATDGSNQGVCIKSSAGELTCVPSANDACVKVGFGRINCCSQQGCADAHGTRCPPDGFVSGACDPIAFHPAGSAGAQAAGGTCNQGFCEIGTTCTVAACQPGTWSEFSRNPNSTLCKKDLCVNQQCTTLNVIDPAIPADAEIHKCGEGLVCLEGACNVPNR